MTSDAKIGLLLGLVFIFIIAFVINGLPGLHHKDDGNKLTTNMVGLESNSSGLGANERRVALEPPPGAMPAVNPANPAGSPDTRSTMALPQGTPIAQDSAPVGDNTIVAPVESTPVVSPQTRITSSAQTAPPVSKPEPAKTAATKIYVVQDGDSLSSIAKKVYGDQQGGKLTNINALFEANRKTLASADDLQVGQKLIVPTLAGSSSPVPTPANVLPGSNFAKVDSVGLRHLTTSPDKPAPAAKTSSIAKTDSTAKSTGIYVVQDGDSLWQIASERLGDGNRYKEIVKLNSDVLANEDNLAVGMQLKMPAK